MLAVDEDLAIKNYILDISCRSKAGFLKEDLPMLEKYVFPNLHELAEDELITWNSGGITLTPQGHYFIRNICTAFDLKINRDIAPGQMFSKAI
jgi:oxygen-independent coproporphyrinogen-3 oxidase